jgi:Flp pilus assembly CpaE family ATPase
MSPTDNADAKTAASSLLDAHGGSRAARIARHLAHALDEAGDTSAADHWRAVLDLTGGGEAVAGS